MVKKAGGERRKTWSTDYANRMFKSRKEEKKRTRRDLERSLEAQIIDLIEALKVSVDKARPKEKTHPKKRKKTL